MATRKREAIDDVPARRFIFSDATGPDIWFPHLEPPGYGSREAAEAAWRRRRREVWAQTRRMSIPKAAEAYDFVFFDCWRTVWSRIGGVWPGGDRLAGASEVIAKDLQSIDDFEREDPAAAAEIADYLAILRDDIERVRLAAEQVAAGNWGASHLLTDMSKYFYGRVAKSAEATR
jgi:hypothetical protein